MNIGFDAKRAFLNYTGLGNYSRSLINILSKQFPDNRYYLYTPKQADNPRLGSIRRASNVQIKTPNGFFSRSFHPLWRSYLLSNDLSRDKIDLYHGLSHEIPHYIKKRKIKSVVTIHDLIFIRFPALYGRTERYIYTSKFKRSCQESDRIIAISDQTKKDIISFFGIPSEKVTVIYQSCDPMFYEERSKETNKTVTRKYGLPGDYLLYVGALTPRKNAFTAIKALHQLNSKVNIPLAIIGEGRDYESKLKRYISQNGLGTQFIFLKNVDFNDFPSIYQNANLFVYPSIFEGFGIPIIEALYSRTPVITSKGSCFPEAGGPDSIYVDPDNTEELADAIEKVLTDPALRDKMATRGAEYVRKFHESNVASQMMQLYQDTVNGSK